MWEQNKKKKREKLARETERGYFERCTDRDENWSFLSCAHATWPVRAPVWHMHITHPLLCCEVCGDVFNRGATYSTERLRVQLCISETDGAANIRGSASDDDPRVLTRRSSPVISVRHHRYILRWTKQNCTVRWGGNKCETALDLTGVRVEYIVFVLIVE